MIRTESISESIYSLSVLTLNSTLLAL